MNWPDDPENAGTLVCSFPIRTLAVVELAGTLPVLQFADVPHAVDVPPSKAYRFDALLTVTV